MRVRYRLPCPVGLDLAELFEGAEVTVLPFSSFSPGALDHVRIEVGSALSLSGALGGHELEVVYGKLMGRHPEALVASVEARLAMRFGPIVYD